MKGPTIVVCSGPPCAGKSALSRDLSVLLDSCRLEMDAIRQRLLPHSPHDECDRTAAYRAMHAEAEDLLHRGAGVILDATYARPLVRDELEAMALRTRARVFLIQCRVPPEVAMARFRNRAESHPALDLTPERVRVLAGEFPYCREGVVLDTTGNPQGYVAEALRYVREGEPILLDGRWSGSAQARG